MLHALPTNMCTSISQQFLRQKGWGFNYKRYFNKETACVNLDYRSPKDETFSFSLNVPYKQLICAMFGKNKVHFRPGMKFPIHK